MNAELPEDRSHASGAGTARVDVVIPVYNEEVVLAKTIGTLREYLDRGRRLTPSPSHERYSLAQNATAPAAVETPSIVIAVTGAGTDLGDMILAPASFHL